MTLGSHKLSCTHLFDYNDLLTSPHRIHHFLGSLQFKRFPIYKQTGPNLTLLQNLSRSTKGHHSDKFGGT